MKAVAKTGLTVTGGILWTIGAITHSAYVALVWLLPRAARWAHIVLYRTFRMVLWAILILMGYGWILAYAVLLRALWRLTVKTFKM